MSKVLSEGTAKKSALAGGRVAAGKTGTTQNNIALWFTGFTPQLATAVVISKPEGGMYIQHVAINGKYQNFWYGADIAAPTWKRYMDQALAGQPNLAFPAPGNNELYGQQILVPDVSGQSIDSAKARLTAAGFHPTVASTGAYSSAPQGTAAGTTPPPGTKTASGGIVTIIPSNGPECAGPRAGIPRRALWSGPAQPARQRKQPRQAGRLTSRPALDASHRRRATHHVRQPLSSVRLASAATAGLGALVWSLIEARQYTLRRFTVPVLPPGARPLKVLHLSDLHLVPSQRAKIAWVRALGELEPDLVINTGDNLANADSLEPVLAALEPLLEVPGAFVMGSNDYYAPIVKNPARYLFPGPRRTRRLPPPDLPGAELAARDS